MGIWDIGSINRPYKSGLVRSPQKTVVRHFRDMGYRAVIRTYKRGLVRSPQKTVVRHFRDMGYRAIIRPYKRGLVRSQPVLWAFKGKRDFSRKVYIAVIWFN